MSRRFAFLLSLALVMAVALTGCGMNKEKAIEQMGQALTDSSVIESGRLTGISANGVSPGNVAISTSACCRTPHRTAKPPEPPNKKGC